LGQLEWQLGQDWTRGQWKIIEKRHIPRDAQNYKITAGVALNTVFGKDDKSLLAY
jgi:hypothetical protein